MATKTTSIVLGDYFADYARRKVASGEFGSTSEVVRDALRRAVADDLKFDALRQAVIEGENSGPPEPWDVDAFLKEQRLQT